MKQHHVRILGLDPGLRHTGWGLIIAEGSRLSYVASGRISTPTEGSLAFRLAQLSLALEAVVADMGPHEAAVEETFVNANARSALKLGHARGICLLAPARLGLPVAEYAANLVKKAVVGAGHAEKHQVSAMISRLMPQARDLTADAADALAVAVCHASHRQHLARVSA
ncbi:crossover junction endodeoxyribonuclease RuvC [Parvularcula sp. LCG005]|uniref:crossover junction endodeoxyribonuclease RuvC n=1 Tax=Parvularcula sp. LCG005 TaxID=3078805 RepID=UPI0029436AF4|nr:crossover junction endodeoxyribonuclease RuvC [Parvularcula sp. LCG005]WOI52809.1 crossover junction endodeoxyribonuclease RuvC [Parvularcula sp. LCG005]